jgi:hypothetical protein
MRDAWRIAHSTAAPWYQGTVRKANGKPAVWTGAVHRAGDAKFAEPLTWRAPRLVFVNSMSDFMLGEPDWRTEALESLDLFRKGLHSCLQPYAWGFHGLAAAPGRVGTARLLWPVAAASSPSMLLITLIEAEALAGIVTSESS